MLHNPEYDLSRLLASALRAKAPYVGIPIPGHAPLIFNRLFLWRALKGVKPVNVEVQTHLTGERLLIVNGVAEEHFYKGICLGRVRHHMKMRSLRRGRWQDKRIIDEAMEKWKPTIAVKASPAPRVSRYDKAIAKLERQLAQLGSRPKIFNPAIASSDDGYNRDTWLKWHQQKRRRGKIGALGAQAKAGKITARELYAALAELTTVKRFSELNTRQKRSLGSLGEGGQYYDTGTFFDYADPKRLWRFLPGLAKQYGDSRPALYGEAWDARERWGAWRYEVVLEWSRARREIESQIEGIRQISADSRLLSAVSSQPSAVSYEHERAA